MKKKLLTIKNSLYLLALIACLFVSSAYGQQNTTSYASNRKFLLRDEGLSKLSYIDLADAKNNWYVVVPTGRDLQLVGNGVVLIGTGTGYEEREIKTGNKVKEVISYPGTVTARRLRNGNTLIVGLNSQGKQGTVLTEVDNSGAIKKLLNFPEFNYVRLVRETSSGTYLITANKVVFESDASGKIIWRANITGPSSTNSWQALRLSNGQTLVSSGYAANFQIFDQDGNAEGIITGPAEVKPNFFAGFQILPNGNYVVANWQGHGPDFGNNGNQLIEYSPDGKLIWSWKQDAANFSSLQGVLVLDGLDTQNMYIENGNGILEAVK